MKAVSGILFALIAASVFMPVRANAQAMQWSEVETSSTPQPRRSHAMAFDQDNNVVVVFGGYGNGSHLDDTWALDMSTKTWKNMHPSLAPSPRAAATLVYDHASKQMILFGGFSLGHSLVSNETWTYSYDSNQWTKIQTNIAPSERASYGMALDSRRHELVLFGGFTESGYFNDLWLYDIENKQWSKVDTGGRLPDPRGAMSFVYDVKNDYFLMFGGFSNEGYFSDTWTFDPKSSDWSQVHTDGSPAPTRTRMIYNDRDGFSVFFGGDMIPSEGHMGSPRAASNTWYYDPSKQSWKEIMTSTAPAPRSLNGIVYDNIADSIVIFGGTDTLIDDANFIGHEFQDTWMLTLDMGGGYSEIAMIVIPVLIVTAAAGAFVIAKKRRRISKDK